MQNFMLLIREDIARVKEMSEQEMQADIEEYTRWVEQLTQSGHYISGEPLEPEGRYLTADEVLSDGPFIEAKEAVSGYILIKAENLEQAVELARGCPIFEAGGALEVRPVMNY